MYATIEVIVKEIKKESPSVKSFKLTKINGSPLPRFSAGSHVVTYIEQDQNRIERHYSLTTSPNKTDFYQIAVRLSDRSKGGSTYWHHEMKEGDRLEISYPRNHFPVSFKARHHVFFAAGIGITPFLAMAADLKAKGKPFELHYAAPSKELCAFYTYLNNHYPNETQFYFSNEKRKMKPHVMEKKPIGTHVYFCGSEAMMKEYAEAAKNYGYHENSIHFELFSPPDLGPQHPFQVKLNKSNQMLQIKEGESLLETLLKNNVQAPYSCRIGGCGSCQVDVLEGEVDHRDLFLSDEEKKNANVILTCVSRGKGGTLVLDL